MQDELIFTINLTSSELYLIKYGLSSIPSTDRFDIVNKILKIEDETRELARKKKELEEQGILVSEEVKEETKVQEKKK